MDKDGKSAADHFWHEDTKSTYAKVLWKDPLSGVWNGPFPVLIWGEGYACSFDHQANSARWLPERLFFSPIYI